MPLHGTPLRYLATLALLGLVLGTGMGQGRQLPSKPPLQPRPSPIPALDTEPLAGDSRPRWKERWSRMLPRPLALSLSPDGQVALLDSLHQVQLLTPHNGMRLWSSQPLLLANTVVAVRGGRVLVGAVHNPQVKKAWLLNARTGQADAFELPGTLWSIAATPDGSRAFFGTGANLILATSLLTSQPPVTWKLSALPETLALSTDGSSAVLGTWLPAGVRRLGGWAYGDPNPARWQEVQVSADGATAISLSGHGARRSEQDLQLAGYDMESGMRLWEKRIPGTRARAQVSADGQRVALTYLSTTQRGGEAHLVLLNRDGSPRGDEKGGRFFSPQLAALSAQGERVTVLDGDRALFVLDGDGKTRWRLALENHAPIEKVLTSPDGAFLLLVRTDGTITLYEALP
ncbi:hypothetical protein [Armatimonas rosea]|uniref:PQQ-like domain-containing protein n=1 Tax=Armatimonas rosea TaxID=685828 RepID=A0A7W9SP89_ARMRO|nr:hypothetical protein [Armatimonas rosea]MBB6049528.1 hypothetical protein [Armatimonas rosea]